MFHWSLLVQTSILHLLKLTVTQLAILNFHLPPLGFSSPAAITVHAALTPFFLQTDISTIDVDLGMHDTDSDSDRDTGYLSIPQLPLALE